MLIRVPIRVPGLSPMTREPREEPRVVEVTPACHCGILGVPQCAQR